MKKGFTLVEMLAVVLILGIILLIGVPIYQGVQKSTNESIYESKIANVKSKAEKYSAESGEFIYDINYMIRQGLLTPDNESGEYRDPRNGRKMNCDIVRIELENDSYYANIEETESCYNIEELQNMNSVVKILFYTSSNGTETFPNGWIRAETVYAGYTIPAGATVTNATWSGGWNVVNDRLEIKASEILNVPITLNIGFEYNGQPYKQTVSRNVMIDLQSPTSTVKTGPGTEPISTLAYVEWRLSDGDGSGVAGHLLLNESQYATKKCYEYTADEIPGDDKTNVGEYLDNGTYYMCVKDNVGNVTNDRDDTGPAGKVIVSNVDYDSGAIKNLKIESKTPPYQLMDVKIITELKDTNTSNHEMCISHTGYLENCAWEKYDANKDYTIRGYNYGDNVLFFISVKDEAGNISNRQGTYTIDNLQYLDLNGKLNGTDQSNITNLGTCDVYINGTKVKASVSDYYEKHVPGTQYTIKNCTSKDGYRYKGNSEVSGTIGRGSASSVYLPYVSLYTITYNMNGGSGSVASQTKEHGTAIQLATTTSTKTGHTYGGWNTNAAGTGTTYNAGANYTGNANVTLYAKWNVKSYVVTWNANGGSCNKTSQSVNYGSQIGTLPTCTKSNYTFQGWYTAASGGTQISTTTIVTQAVTYYARWKENNYTITFNANGGTASQTTRTINAGSTLGTLPTATKTSVPAAFSGWYTAQTGGSKISSSTKPTGNTTYYAHWSNDLVIPFDVTFNWDNVRGYSNLYAKVTMAFKNNQVGKGVRYHQYTEATGSFQNANDNYNRPGKYSTNSYSYWLNYSEGSGILTTNPSGQNTQDGGYLYNWAPLVVKGKYNRNTRFYDWSGPWSATKYWINQQVNSGSTLDMLETLMSPSAVYVVSNERSGYDQYNVGIRGYVIKVADYAKVDYTCTMSGSGPYHFRFKGTITLGNYALSMPKDSTIRGQTNPNNYPGESIDINSYYPTSLAFRFMDGDIVSVPISIN